MSEKDILAAILKGSNVAKDEAQKQLGIDEETEGAVGSSDSFVVSKTIGSEDSINTEAGIDTTNVKGMRRGARRKPRPEPKSVKPENEEKKAVLAKPELKAVPKVELTPAELEDQQVREFVESIPDGEVIVLVSQNGKKEYYRRSGMHLEGKNDGNIKTLQAWKRHRDGWKMEKEPKKVVSRPTLPVPDVVTVADVSDTQRDDFTSGKVFADEYLELNPPGGSREAVLPSFPTLETKVTDADYDLAECREGETLYYFSKNDNKGYALKYRGGDEYTLIYPAGSRTVNEIYVRRHILEDWKRVSELDAKKEEELYVTKKESESAESKPKKELLKKDDAAYVDDEKEVHEPDMMEGEEVAKDGTPEADEVFKAYGRSEVKDALYEKIENLKKEVEEMRAKYVKEDYENTNAWAKMKGFFGKFLKKETAEGDASKSQTAFWQAQYDDKLRDLYKLEIEQLELHKPEGEVLNEARAKQLRYYKIDEKVNVIDARTQYRAENQTLSVKIADYIAALGRDYNSIPLKRKLLYAGAFIGLGFGPGMTGGVAAGALASVLTLKRIAAGMGTAIGTEAALEKYFGDYRPVSKAEKEIKEQLGGAEVSKEQFAQMIEKEIFSLDTKLQNEKIAKTWRKLGAVGVGGLVGSGWLTDLVMDKLGGHEAVEWVKEKWTDITGETVVPSGSRPSTGKISGLPTTPEKEIPIIPSQPETAPQRWGGAIDKDFGGPESPADAGGATQPAPETTGETPKAPVLSPNVPDVEPPAPKPDFISDFVSKDITVQKGEPLWKIIDQNLASQTDLEGPQRTHFIDAVKDKYGDVLLKEGEVINFSAHGIDKEFIEQAWADAKAITPEQALSIDANDAKIAEFAKVHPEVTLTNESVDTILQGDETETPSANEISDGDARDGGTTTFVGANEDDLKHADIQPDRDIVLGKAYDLKNYTEYFKKYPEAFAQFKKIGETYMEFSFQGDQDIMNAIGGKTFAELDSSPSTSFDAFIDKAREAYGSKYGLPQPKEKVYEYIARIAMLGIEHPTGKLLRFPQSV
jgi:hypothetical protein